WRYTTLSPPAAVQRFYDGVLPGDGWARKAAATNAVMWRRDELALAVQAEVRDGATQVLLLLTPARRER
ncbi:MAG: hypothetical protein HYU66_09175, partial [Armatimonadetes bacterium]|nr:hypothetical protein [Armatimonadota bacterium]